MSYKQVKYNVAALFASKEATGTGHNQVDQLHRVTSLNDSFEVPYQDALQIGQLAPFTRLSIGTPTPTLSFEYYAHNGYNEDILGFNVNAMNQVAPKPMLEDILKGVEESKNYFIIWVPEGNDAAGYNTNTNIKTVAIGNGYITNYSFNASVGEFLTCSASVEGLNYRVYSGKTALASPAVDPDSGEDVTGETVTVPNATDGASLPKVLRPGDITFTFDYPDNIPGVIMDQAESGKAHIQSFSLDIPLSRTPIERLGSNFAFTRDLEFPINATLSVEVNVSDLQNGSLSTLINNCGAETFDAEIEIKGCNAGGTSEDLKRFKLVGISFDSQSSNLATGAGGRTASLSFAVRIGGPQDTSHNIYLHGKTIPDVV